MVNTITRIGEKENMVYVEVGQYLFRIENNADFEKNLKRKISMLHRTGAASSPEGKDDIWQGVNETKKQELIGKTEATL